MKICNQNTYVEPCLLVYGSQSKINLKSLPKLQLQANPSTLSPLKIGIAFMQMHEEHNSWNGLRHDVSYDVTGCDLPWRHWGMEGCVSGYFKLMYNVD